MKKMKHQNKCKKYRIECYLCRIRSNHMKRLQNHMVIRHTGLKKFQCKICSKFYSCENNLKIHLESHSKRYTVKCNYCPRIFAHSL